MGLAFAMCLVARQIQALQHPTGNLRAQIAARKAAMGVAGGLPAINARVLGTQRYPGSFTSGTAPVREFYIALDMNVLMGQPFSKRFPDAPRATNAMPLATRRDMVWDACAETIQVCLNLGFDGVVCCFDDNRPDIFYDATNTHGNYRLGPAPAGGAAPAERWVMGTDYRDYIEYCKARCAHFGIPVFDGHGMNGETAAAYCCANGFEGHAVGYAFSTDIDVLDFSPSSLVGGHLLQPGTGGAGREPMAYSVNRDSNLWGPFNIPPLGADSIDIVASFAAAGCLTSDAAWYKAHHASGGLLSRLRGAAATRPCLLFSLTATGHALRAAGAAVTAIDCVQDYIVPAFVQIRLAHPPAAGGANAYGTANDIFAKLEAHRLNGTVFAGGLANTTPNGDAAANHLLTEWSAFSNNERDEAAAFRDWHGPNIK